MRREASVLHLDLDAFFAAVEQRDKPSLRGRPVVVGELTGGQRMVTVARWRDDAIAEELVFLGGPAGGGPDT